MNVHLHCSVPPSGFFRGASKHLRAVAAIVLALIAFTLCPSATAALPTAEQTTLTALYNQTAGSTWYTSTNWQNGGDPCAAAPKGWYGITCDAAGAHVTGIALSGNNLTGTLPSLANLTALTTFDVGFNELTGSIPNLAGLASLQSFAANSNALSGSIPALGGLANLTSFDVNTNQLTGSIPTLSGLTGLSNFVVFNNKLSGSVPALTGLVNLQTFNINTNQLSGAMPDLTGLVNLAHIDVSYNSLSGAIPALSGSTALIDFYARNNQLSGAIPSVSGLSHLAYFDVSRNSLSSVPALSGLPKLAFIDLSFNQITGSLPALTGLPALNAFYARNNQLTGSIPALPTFAGSAPLLDVSYNQLSGSIPDISATKLAIFNVDNNALTGAAPPYPATILAQHSALCPNLLSHAADTPTANDTVWNQATALTPWSMYCGVATVTTISFAANPIQAGSATMVTVTVAPSSGNGTPTGTVTLTDSIDSSATCSITLAAGSGSCSLTFVSAGAHTVTGSYDGGGATSTYAASSSSANLNVNGVTLTSSANPSVFGKSVTFTATVTGTAPTGMVTFSDGANALGTVAVSGGQAKYSTAALANGSHTITASYSGDKNNAQASAPALTQQVLAATTTSASVQPVIALGSSASVSFSVSVVAPGTGTPTGTVTIYGGGAGCTGTLSAGSGSCTFGPTTPGNDGASVKYSGDANYAASSTPISFFVTGNVASTVSITSSAATSVYGQSVTFTATLNGQTPTGTVTFSDGSNVLCNAVPVTGSGNSVAANCTPSNLGVGNHSIVASYPGDINNLPSTSAALAQTVTPASTTLGITLVSPNPITLGESTTVSTTLSVTAPGAGTPTGTITISDGTVSCSFSTPANNTCSITPVTTGPKSVVATYAGDGNFGSSKSASAALAVNPVTFTVTPSAGANGALSPSTPQTVISGAATSFTVTPASGYGIATITGCGGSLSGNLYTTAAITDNCAVSVTFSANPVNGVCGSDNAATLLAAPVNLCSAGAPSAIVGNGPWMWSCVGSNGGSTATCGASIATWTVQASAGAGGSITPPSQTVNNGATTSFTMTPASGYGIATITGCGGSLSGNLYTTAAITDNCAVSVTFSANPVNGVCGSDNAATLLATPVNLCSAGAPSAIVGNGPWTWSCVGSNGGSTATCGASIATWTVQASAGAGGSITPPSQTVNNGATTSFTVTPASGYGIATITGCGGSLSGNLYTTAAITANCTVSVTFSANPVNGVCGSDNGKTLLAQPTNLCSAGAPSAIVGSGPWTWSCVGSNGGSTATCGASIATWTVQASAGAGGSITPPAQTVNNGATTSFTVTPASGYGIATITGCGGTMSDALTYSTAAITANCMVNVTFSANPVNGACGSDNAATLLAAPVNLCSAGAPSAIVGSGPWTWSCVGSNGGSTAGCSANIATWTVQASAGAGGSITPPSQTVNNGATTSFTVTPASGFSIASVTGCGGSISGVTYTTAPVTANCTVTATFSAVLAKTFSVSTTAGAQSGSLSGGGNACGFSGVTPTDTATYGTPPTGLSFPEGLLDLQLQQCDLGSSVVINITYPIALPTDTQYWKFGATPSNSVPHWYAIPAVVNGNTISLTLTDGALGDDDLAVNGVIRDPGGPALPASSAPAAEPAPLLQAPLLLVLGFGLLAIGYRYRQSLYRNRRRR